MPSKVQYNIFINCKKCDALFFKKEKCGLTCYKCRKEAKEKSRKNYTKCQYCHLPKKEDKSSMCSACHKARYRTDKIKIWSKNKIKKTESQHQMYKDVMYRIKYKQSSFLFTLSDINDIIEIWLLFCKKRSNEYDHMPSGLQISMMWKDLLEIEDKMYAKNKN
jgi:hypothetical protein